LDYCKEHGIGLMTYGALCRGFLSGKMSGERKFKGDDLRRVDPKFKGERFKQYLEAANRLKKVASERYDKELIHLALRWLLDRGIETPIWGARKPSQLDPVDEIWDFEADRETMEEIDSILEDTVKDPVGPEFMAPPDRRELKG
jgi:aryl-alcohol dehydrogenase-like predicted oxidoreductase